MDDEMPRYRKMLSSRRVATARPKRGRTSLVIADGGNLYLQVTLGDGGHVRRSWVFRYGLDGRKREMGLGPTHTITLAEARDEAEALRKMLVKKIDPLEAREAARRARLAEQASAVTFGQCAKMYLSLHEAGWSAIHRRQWNASLRTYVYRKIGDLPVRHIDQAAVMKVVEPIWTAKPTTAGRVRSRIEAIFDYATANGFRTGDNPARIAAALPKKAKIAPVEHFAALPWQDVPQFMSELRGLQSVAALCTQFLVLTAARSGEAIGATWDEVDLKAKTWTIPAERMKNRTLHRVPLSAAAVALLSGLPKEGPYIFGGRKRLQETALRRQVLHKLRPGNGGGRFSTSTTVHGFRSAFMDWAHEQTAFPKVVIDMALAHTVSDKVEAAYRRGDLFEKRRRLMQAWATYCTRPAAAGAVVTLRARA